MILLIDNYDSFTYNLFQQLESLGAGTRVVAHDRITLQDIKRLQPTHIVISPGPKRPRDSGICPAVIRHFYATIPILGVCLGHECIGAEFGARVVHARQIMHGKTSLMYHTARGLFKAMPSPFEAARYHSLAIDRVPDEFLLSAWDSNNEIMAISHRNFPVHGIQFHPESFMTKHGSKLIRNFLYESHNSTP